MFVWKLFSEAWQNQFTLFKKVSNQSIIYIALSFTIECFGCNCCESQNWSISGDGKKLIECGRQPIKTSISKQFF